LPHAASIADPGPAADPDHRLAAFLHRLVRHSRHGRDLPDRTRCLLSIAINATHGARDVGRNLVRAARMMGARERDVVLRVVLPNALPAIFTGMRLGLGVAWTAVIVAEIVAVKSGLGYVLWDAYYVGRMDVVLADMVSIGLAGFLSDRLMLLLASACCIGGRFPMTPLLD